MASNGNEAENVSKRKQKKMTQYAVIERTIAQNIRDQYFFNNNDPINEVSGNEESDSELSNAKQIVRKFANNEAASELHFDGYEAPLLSPTTRSQLHAFVDQYKIGHQSVGEGLNRHLVLFKLIPTKLPNGTDFAINEVYFDELYMGLRGPFVDAVANYYGSLVPDELKANRRSRDGEDHHITIAGKKVLTSLPEGLDRLEIFKSVSGVLNDWSPEGLGSLSEAGNVVFFVIVKWQSMVDRLRSLGLPPQTFHITIGFLKSDIHDVPKDISTLIDVKTIQSLISVAVVKPSAPLEEPKKKHQDQQSQKGSKSTRRLSAWMIFAQEQREVMSKNNPNLSIIGISKLLAQHWAQMKPEERKIYEDKSRNYHQENENATTSAPNEAQK